MNKVIEIAMPHYGLEAIPGQQDNPKIVEMFKEISFGGIVDDDTPWCSCFANWVCMKAGFVRSKKLNARSWLEVGTEVKDPVLGDVVVLWRDDPKSNLGHVGFFINFTPDKKRLYILGGNQGNKVCIVTFPTSQVLSFRRLDSVL